MKIADKEKFQKESTETRRLVRFAFQLARSLEIRKLMVHADELNDIRSVERFRKDESVIWLVKSETGIPTSHEEGDIRMRIPEAPLNRVSQIQIGLFLTLINSYIDFEESLVCLSGLAEAKRLDTLIIANPSRDFPWFQKGDFERTRNLVEARVLARVIEIALRFAGEGREGKPIGTVFVIGDPGKLDPYLRQMILNPCAGHAREQRNIFRPGFIETLREYAQMDGAFMVDNSGVVESAATYINAPIVDLTLRPGLGARHLAAASISAQTEAIAIAISESSGSVTVFHEGKTILELEKPSPRYPSAEI